MAGRGNLLRQFLQATTGESTSEGSGSGAKRDSGLDTNSPSMTVRSQGRGKILDYNISQSSSSEGAGLPIAGRGRAVLATIGRGSSGSNVGGGDDSDSAVGSAIGSVPAPTSSGRGGVGRGNFFKCLQMMGDVSVEKKAAATSLEVDTSKETSKDEAISSMEVSVPEDVPKDPVIMKGKAGEFFVCLSNCKMWE